MPAKKAAAKAAPTPRNRGKNVALPDSVTSEGNVSWPGSNRGSGGANSALRQQLADDIAGMTMGSVRRYDIADEAQQKSFSSLFRKVCDEVHGPIYGVQTAVSNGALFVKLGNRRQATAK